MPSSKISTVLVMPPTKIWPPTGKRAVREPLASCLIVNILSQDLDQKDPDGDKTDHRPLKIKTYQTWFVCYKILYT